MFGETTMALAWPVAGAILIVCLLCTLCIHRYRQLYRATLEERENHRELIDNLSEGIYRSSLDGRQLSANPALVRLNGYDSEAQLLAGVKDIATEWYVDPTRREAFRNLLERDGKVENFVSEIYRHKTRERIWITESARLVRDKKSGRPLFYEGSVREITETMERLRFQEMFQKLTSQLPGGLFQLVRRRGGRFWLPYASEGFCKILDHDATLTHLDPSAFLHMVHPEDRAYYLRSLRDSGMGMTHWDCEFRLLTGDGREKWLRATAMPEAIEDGVIWHGYLSDISARKRNEMKIEKLAFYDPLTNLPNRRFLLDRMSEAMRRCAENDLRGALLFIDLDNFKVLNDTMGHGIGDAFLVQVANRLRAAVGPDDLVARMGGDEFVILLAHAGEGLPDASRDAIVAANRVLAALRQDFQIGHMAHQTSASIGVLVFDGHEAQPETVMKHADMAMYQVKSSGRNGVALFDPAALEAEAQRFRLLADLRAALADNRLELHYQPQIGAENRIVGAEALVRWHHDRHGMVPPADFVGLAEQFGLAETLGRRVVEMGLATLAQWRTDPALAELRLGLNISVQSLRDGDFVDFLQGQLEAHGLAPHLLTLELTERVMARNQGQVARRMKELKALGVRLSLDDFGTGGSSIAHLKKLPFDELKIDGSFVADIDKGDNDRALLRTMLSMAATLDMTVVAEQVETGEQAAFLRECGCALLQGWHYGAAVPAADFARLVRARSPAPVLQFPTPRRGA